MLLTDQRVVGATRALLEGCITPRDTTGADSNFQHRARIDHVLALAWFYE